MARMVIAPGGYPNPERLPGQDVTETDDHPLTGLAAKVRDSQIQALLTGRRSDLLSDPDNADLLLEIKRGVGAEVGQLLDNDGRGLPEDLPQMALDLATWAVALGVAANIESSLFPEQQLGEDARSQQLQVRYLGVREQLVALTAAGGTGDPDVSAAGPQAAGFTPPQPWPEALPAWPTAAWVGYPGWGGW